MAKGDRWVPLVIGKNGKPMVPNAKGYPTLVGPRSRTFPDETGAWKAARKAAEHAYGSEVFGIAQVPKGKKIKDVIGVL